MSIVFNVPTHPLFSLQRSESFQRSHTSARCINVCICVCMYGTPNPSELQTLQYEVLLYRTHKIFLDFFHRPVFQKTRHFGNWICFRPQVKVIDM
jgi:hypothetical protein